MPSIIATPQPVQGRVLIQVNWSDYPDARFARVSRVEVDGTTTVVRATTATDPSGEYMELSGGQAILYDTEAPLDVALTYTTEALGVTGASIFNLIVSDTYTRVLAAGSWGTPDIGPDWTLVGNDPDFSVNGTTGLVSQTAVDVEHKAVVALGSTAQRLQVDILLGVTPTGAFVPSGLLLGYVDANNYYWADVRIETSSSVTVRVVRRLAGVSTQISSLVVTGQTHSTSIPRRIVAELINPGTVTQTIRITTYPSTSPALSGWILEHVDSAVSGGTQAGVNSRLSPGSTNATPVVFQFDNFLAYDLDAPASTSTDLVLPSGGGLWLKAPLRPWADQRVVLDVPQEPDCVPESAIFFQQMTEEARQNRSGAFVVNNRKNPVHAGRLRGGISSALGLVSRNFVDRDNVIVLNEAGDPLLFQGPADYGIPDRYMSVGDYTVARLSPDHRREWRAHVLPHVEVDRPAGLADGVLGNRWLDICDVYATFDQAETAGLTWTLVLLGQAALVPTPDLGFRFYSDIPLDFATYAAIPVGGRTYEDLLEDR